MHTHTHTNGQNQRRRGTPAVLTCNLRCVCPNKFANPLRCAAGYDDAHRFELILANETTLCGITTKNNYKTKIMRFFSSVVSWFLCVVIDVIRLSGLENGLLGLNSKVNAVVWAKNIADVENMDIICFGHLLFEMCTGYELPSPRPTAGHLQLDLERYPQVFDDFITKIMKLHTIFQKYIQLHLMI